ncbi:MAG: cellulose synthase [Fibrobacteres bacterium]|nr:cellulose synthase [Fibrobacterota bacterium]
MGEVTCDTGTRTIRISVLDRILMFLLLTAAVESALYFADFWFLGGHRKNLWLFPILSYAVFRSIGRNVVSWFIFQFTTIPKPGPARPDATVDVLMTAMPGEPFAMFETSLKAIAAIRHPHQAYLLDGGNDPALRDICARLGINHIDCRGIQGAKAGKINHCLRNHAKGEFVLILDPDHIAEPDFLDRTLPCFTSGDIAFVQVVQAYHNVKKSWVAHGAAEQTFGFYGPLMMGLGGLGVPVAIGANCTFRRKALDDIGGHAESLAEDANTSLRMHAKGWKSVYLPYRASYGLVPEDLRSFYHQQLKWAAGMFRLFLGDYLRNIPRFGLAARLNYFFSGGHYLVGFATMLTMVLPILFLFGRIFAVEMSFTEFAWHIAPYLFFSTWMSLYVQRWYSDDSEKGFPWRSMFLEKGTWFIYFLAFAYTLAGKKVLYLPTPKTADKGGTAYLALPHVIVIVLSAAAVAYAWLTYPRIDDGTRLMAVFAVLNIVSLLPVTWICLRDYLPFRDRGAEA